MQGHVLDIWKMFIERESGAIICTFFGTGQQHDSKVFQASGIHFHPDTKSLQDKGYQGIQKLRQQSELPIKKPKGGQRAIVDFILNRSLARERIGIEHVNRRLKTFRILAGCYRNRRRRYGLRCNLIAAIYNLEYPQAA